MLPVGKDCFFSDTITDTDSHWLGQGQQRWLREGLIWSLGISILSRQCAWPNLLSYIQNWGKFLCLKESFLLLLYIFKATYLMIKVISVPLILGTTSHWSWSFENDGRKLVFRPLLLSLWEWIFKGTFSGRTFQTFWKYMILYAVITLRSGSGTETD